MVEARELKFCVKGHVFKAAKERLECPICGAGGTMSAEMAWRVGLLGGVLESYRQLAEDEYWDIHSQRKGRLRI